jgi:sulfite exporter TauE/SafE
MSELPLIVLGGLLGSSHCVGMCGPFALTIGLGSRSWSTGLARQLAYSLGRVFTYSCAGAFVGYGGFRIAAAGDSFGYIQAAFCLFAGTLLVLQGLLSLNLLPRLTRHSGPSLACGALRNFGGLLRSARLTHVFLAGLFTGFLPCGLVYAYLALAASTADLFHGLATLAAFGVGTVPAMVLAGAGGQLLSLAARRRMFQVAACCVILTGLLTIDRGARAWLQAAAGIRTCPYCAMRNSH